MSHFNKLTVGEVLSESQFYTVEKVVGSKVQLKNDTGESIVVNDDYVNNQLSSAAQFETTEKLNKTDLAQLFIDNARVAMTVNFNKQVKPEDVTEGVVQIYDELGMGMTKADFKKKVKSALSIKGEERTMVGRHYGSTDVNGRIHFIDMEQPKTAGKTYDTRQRLVDPRTINYVIVGNVKYQLK